MIQILVLITYLDLMVQICNLTVLLFLVAAARAVCGSWQ